MSKQQIRKLITTRLQALGWTPYRLAKELAGQVKMRTLYDYVNGTQDMTGEKLAAVFDALDLEIVPRAKR